MEVSKFQQEIDSLRRILGVVSDASSLSKLPVDKFTDLFVKL